MSLEDLENDEVPSADKVGPNVLNAWIHGDLLTVNMLGMAHPEFSSMFQRRESAQRFAENQVADYGREDANTSYAWTALYTRKFLDAHLKHDASAEAFWNRLLPKMAFRSTLWVSSSGPRRNNPVQTSNNGIGCITVNGEVTRKGQNGGYFRIVHHTLGILENSPLFLDERLAGGNDSSKIDIS